MLKYFKSFFSYDDEEELSANELYELLTAPEEESTCADNGPDVIEPDVSEYMCFSKTGTITASQENTYEIDGKYSYTTDAKTFPIGARVTFKIYNINRKVSVVNVKVIDDWDTEEITPSTSKWCDRKIVCCVNGRRERKVYLTPGELVCDLNDVKTEFIPIVGDWVVLIVKSEIDDRVFDLGGEILEITSIVPLRINVTEGFVKWWNNDKQIGNVSGTIYFDRAVCVDGYLPRQGDKVIVEAIESNQDVYTWRAVKILPNNKENNKTCSKVLPENDLLLNKNDITVSDHLYFDLVYNENYTFNVEIANHGKKECLLVDGNFKKKSAQYTLLAPIDNVPILPGQSIKIVFNIHACYLGTTIELFVFNFNDCKIGRNVTLHCRPNKVRYVHQMYKRRNVNTTLCNINYNDVVLGEKIRTPPRYIARRLYEYPCPDTLVALINDCNERKMGEVEILELMDRTQPRLLENLVFENYEDRFHFLLFLYELVERHSIRQYDQEAAVFVKNDEFLMLEIENLAERRPSIIIGDKVIAWDANKAEDDTPKREGIVHKITKQHVYLKFGENFHNVYDGEDYKVHVICSRTVFKRLHQAINLAVKKLGSDFLFPTRVVTKPPQIKQLKSSNIETSKNKFFLAHSKHLNKTDLSYNIAWFNKNLNVYQKAAVANILLGVARPLPYIIFGPPGTGKTITIIETILQILHLLPHSRLLVATPSNSSADLLALRLIDSKYLRPGDMLRVVAYRCVIGDLIPPALVPYSGTLEIAREGTCNRKTCIENNVSIGLSYKVMGRHRITIGTCMTLSQLYNCDLAKGHFTHFIIDEAGQAIEPEIMVPLAFLEKSCGQVVLAGDPLQLGPVLPPYIVQHYGLGESLLERFINRYPYICDPEGFPESGGYDPRVITKLLYNYRSLPEILKLPNELFYRGELIPTISETDSAEAKLLEKLDDILPSRENGPRPSMIFHGIIGENFQTEDCPSWFNPYEASQVFYYLNELKRLGITHKNIGVITPYIKQVHRIRALLNEAEFDLPKIGTVEEFQGQEFSVIILSTVRSNERYLQNDQTHSLGFVSSPRRLNVAITRAKALTIIIGNPVLLYTDSYWRNVLEYCVRLNNYIGCDFTLPGS